MIRKNPSIYNSAFLESPRDENLKYLILADKTRDADHLLSIELEIPDLTKYLFLNRLAEMELDVSTFPQRIERLLPFALQQITRILSQCVLL